MSGGAGTGGAGEPRVVVGIDGSAGSRAALRHGLDEARRRGARLEVVAAFISPERLAVVNRLPIVTEREAVAAAAEAAARTEVDEVVAGDLAEHPEAPAPPIAVRAVAGDPGPVLTEAAVGAQLLVVGHRGRGGVASTVLGSVAWWCLRHAPCPLTVVPPPGEHPRAAAADDRVTAVPAGVAGNLR